MKKRDLQNADLDRTGRKLLETARVSGEELDKIVGSPQLFDVVKARIKAERGQRERQSKTGFGDWLSLPVWNWRKTGAAFAAVLTLFALCAFGVIVFMKQKDSPSISAQRITPPRIQLSPAPVNTPAPPALPGDGDLPGIEKVKNSPPKNSLSFQKAVFRKETAALPKQTPRKKNFNQTPRQRRQNEIEPEGEFYALTYAGNPGEAGEDLRIIRAELSRASLFALGVNLPIENESEKIKTDLLVGADGVVKAIGFVR